jgi:hypothetical protein
VTELGMRMFDLEMTGDSMRPVFVFDALNKPKLVTALVRNFETILLLKWFNKKAEIKEKAGKEILHLKDKEHHLFLSRNTEQYVMEQKVFKKYKKETRTIYTNNYNTIKLKQYGFVKLFIELDKINE